ncbi:hypothetical protein DRI50_01285 [candidate division KSB1 bacterium]|nr:MAG: hypothetical protein DRI50_01285 [candidate division KSB1 bacterium]
MTDWPFPMLLFCPNIKRAFGCSFSYRTVRVPKILLLYLKRKFESELHLIYLSKEKQKHVNPDR